MRTEKGMLGVYAYRCGVYAYRCGVYLSDTLCPYFFTFLPSNFQLYLFFRISSSDLVFFFFIPSGK